MPGRTSPLPFIDRTSPLLSTYRTSPLRFNRIIRPSADFICLVEIDFDTGTEYFSFDGVGTPTNWYEPLVESIGEISRESPLFGDEYRVSDVEIGLINTNRYFTKKKGTPASFYGRVVRILYGDAQDGSSRMLPIFTGRIYKWKATEGGRFAIQARDFSFARFGQQVFSTLRTLTPSVFPLMPVGSEPRLVPVVYGACNVDSAVNLTTYDLGGPIPCYLVDTNAAGKWRYVVAQHVCKSVDTVFVYGVKIDPSYYTVATATYDGISMTVLDFNSDPRQSNRSSEVEVTAAVSGITDNGLTSGTLLTNPVDIIVHYMINYTSTSSGEIDQALQSTARTATASAGYQCALAVVQKDTPHSEILTKWVQSFNASIFVTRESKIGIFVKTPAIPATPFVVFTSDVEILNDSFEVDSNEQVASELQYSYLYHFARDFFGKQPPYTVPGQETALGDVHTRELNLWYVRDATTALAVATSFADLLKENVEYPTFDLTPDQYVVVDLNSFVGLTHWQGVSASGGYEAVTIRIFSIGLNPTPREMIIKVSAVKL